MIHKPSLLIVLLVFVVLIAGCCALVSFQATHIARPTVRHWTGSDEDWALMLAGRSWRELERVDSV